VDQVLGLTFNCHDAPAQARLWALALGYVPAPPPGWDTWEAWLVDLDVPREERDDGASLVDPAGIGPGISFLEVSEPKTAKNRFHLDLKVSGGGKIDPEVRRTRIMAKVDEVVAAGATIQAEHHWGEHLDHVVLLDPEGNEFCVA
jgi:hypothetical protein